MLLVVVVLLFSGCEIFEGDKNKVSKETVEDLELLAKLNNFASLFSTTIRHTTLKLNDEIATSKVRKINLFFKIRSTKAMSAMLRQGPAPVRALKCRLQPNVTSILTMTRGKNAILGAEPARL